LLIRFSAPLNAQYKSSLGRRLVSPYLLKVAFANEDMIGNGSIFNSVGKDELAKFQLLQPDNDLVVRFQSIASNIDEQIERLSKIVGHLEKTRDLLLPRIISGKLSVENLDIQFPPGMAEELRAQGEEEVN
jgi:type I restriction enzyme, S subunit